MKVALQIDKVDAGASPWQQRRTKAGSTRSRCCKYKKIKVWLGAWLGPWSINKSVTWILFSIRKMKNTSRWLCATQMDKYKYKYKYKYKCFQYERWETQAGGCLLLRGTSRALPDQPCLPEKPLQENYQEADAERQGELMSKFKGSSQVSRQVSRLSTFRWEAKQYFWRSCFLDRILPASSSMQPSNNMK